MSFLPVSASKTIVDKYIRYLKTIFQINDKTYSDQFEKALYDEKSFAKGPYIEISASFVKGKSINELINDGILSRGFKKVNMPLTRPLYKHQEEAILKVINEKNIVVSTGTGSGKTESFLIPVLNYLLCQEEIGQLSSGVRALIIYPMNALANDQIERLRELLKDTNITYGCYTGQTKEKYEDALVEYQKLNDGKKPYKNELISREQMKKNPPNILITNYAMLEYLMVRPDDNVFFDGEYSDNWKFIILDEAHVYRGSTGIEVSMLLRRLKAKLKKDDIRYILTSATLGGEKDNIEVAEFASNLCDSNFDKDNIIRAKRIKIEVEDSYREINPNFYNEVVKLLNNGESDNKIIDFICNSIDIERNEKIEELLYDIVVHDKNYWAMRSFLDIPKTVSDIAQYMKWSEEDVQNFITVASKCEKNFERLLDARYHMFLRATDSVFITLKPSSKLFLTRKEKHFEGKEEYRVFEIATCSYCHSIYIIGKKDENDYLVQSNFANEEMEYVFLLSDSISNDDEEHSLENEGLEFEEYNLCSRCGRLNRIGAKKENCCEHDSKYYVKVFKIEIKNDSKRLTKCPNCENTNSTGVLRMFFTGQEAVTSVIGTALFEELPSYSIKQEIIEEEDDTGFGFNHTIVNITKTNLAKQFIAFSDNRQAAAFFSSYLDQTYRNILYKRLIIETLKDSNYSKRGKTFNIFIDELISNFEKYKIASNNVDLIKKEAWKAGLLELVDNNGNTSLNSLGLIGICLSGEFKENKRYNLSAKDVETICNVFALGMMTDCAIYYEANLNSFDKEYFTYNRIEWSYTLSDNDNKNFKRSFVPLKYNKRFDYLSKVLKKAGFDLLDDEVRHLLEGLWKLFSTFYLKSSDGGYKIDCEKILINRPSKWYICSKCKRITIHNAFNVCPSFKCDGELVEIDINEYLKNNHYYNIYNQLDIKELRVVEHTAQLSKEMAYEYQRKFKNKEIDVLSCSTTFEMGVDVGTLETVFMRNMPPSPSNYAQRAGRAGRSKHSCAYAITFCNKSSHDFTFFVTPEKMIKGTISPPKFKIENEKIAIRHLYASALGFFWKNILNISQMHLL
ncbi:DEAD/DEAH box helicase [Caloramator proteoclasticus]|uniref:Helicase conserved C-terminal domain-containing protein n=1 Tax=Caloramator proteoclasticus DSM 10124 TaxID=1121262 RepID=A0A1M4T4C9_9CLOT|nr:DEAD/DEAH box helicase [Caloramator proteoclasticus]SHE39208.1 Helicase conserved C-terminal domain-containing protein [Caloramator proteoclasticus DSM 10124]